MPFNIQQSNELLKKSSDKMWSSMEFRPQKDKLKEKSSSRDREKSKTKSSSRDRDKLKTKSVVDPCHKAKQDITLGEIFQRESVEESTSSTQSEELVKYMSNLPGYLKRSDGGVNIQEKALNFGVLDWSQLEKWKNKQPHFTSFNSNEESSSSRAATTSSTTARGHRKLDDKKGSRSSRIKGSYKGALPQSSILSSQNVQQYQTSGKKIIGGEHRMRTWEFESNGKTRLDTSLQKKKRREYDKIASTVGSFPSKSRHHGVSLVVSENSNDRDIEGKSMQGLQQQHSPKKKEKILKSSSDKGIPSLEPKNKCVSFGSQKKMSSRSGEAKIKMDHWQESYIDAGQKQCHGMPRDIVLLRPRKFLQPRFDDYFQLSHSITSSDDNLSEASHSSSSYISLHEEFHTKEAYSDSDTIHSSVLPSATGLASSSEAIQDHSAVESKKLGCSNKMSSLQSEESCAEKDVLDIKLRNQCSFSNMKESKDHETAELKAERAWNNPSQCRLNFGLNQIGRSLSFKEGSILPINVSAKSGPLISESSACVNNLSKDKVKGHKRSKSSPFMRLLDPILKHKASNIDQSSESSLTPKGSMKSVSFMTNPLDAEKSKESSIQALLQLTIKNGQPLFKFVLNSERKVLAATMNSLASAEKDDGSCYFTFYLVNEIKKKSGKWMSHWSKEKNCGFVYNIVGQMKISSSKITESSNKNFKGQFMVKDYVLFGVSIDQTDQGPPEFIKSRELAAAVIEIPCENVSHEGVHSINLLNKECLKCLFSNERCFCISQENDISGSITVILPGGVHSSPNKGEPSPLIHRWKLGGLCDCGGWDVGCKLLVLSNQNPNSNIPRSSKPPPQRFRLFVKEGAEQDTPLFILEPLKDGLYSVEFSSTITHLQAFFISVAVISSKKLPSSLEMSSMQEEINKELSIKNRNELQEKAPKNYNQIPPLSPVDRV